MCGFTGAHAPTTWLLLSAEHLDRWGRSPSKGPGHSGGNYAAGGPSRRLPQRTGRSHSRRCRPVPAPGRKHRRSGQPGRWGTCYFIFFVGSVASYNICSLQHEWPLTHPVSSLTPLWGLFLCVSMHVGRDTEGVVMAGFMGHSPEDILRNAVTLWGCVLLNTARIGSC